MRSTIAVGGGRLSLPRIVLKKLVEFYGGMIQIINRDEDGVRVTIMFETTKKE